MAAPINAAHPSLKSRLILAVDRLDCDGNGMRDLIDGHY